MLSKHFPPWAHAAYALQAYTPAGELPDFLNLLFKSIIRLPESKTVVATHACADASMPQYRRHGAVR
jgi:hypothetical protein